MTVRANRTGQVSSIDQPYDEPVPSSGRSLGKDVISEEDMYEFVANGLEKSKRRWQTTSDRSVFWGAADVEEQLPPGLYKCFFSDETGHAFRKLIICTDDLILDENAITSTVVREIVYFWTDEVKNKFKERGFLYKRGILMFGEPGTGKTAAIQTLIQKVINMGGIAVYSDDPHILTACLQLLRRVEPTRPVVVVLEDFETLTDRQHRENEWLSVLDGEAQIDNVVFLGTTNYIDKLDKRFTDRPSRFDIIVAVPGPTAVVRARYLRSKAPELSLSDIKRWVSATKGFSIAHLKELLISVTIFNREFQQELERLREMKEREYGKKLERLDDDGNEITTGFIKVEPTNDAEQVDWDKFEKEYFS